MSEPTAAWAALQEDVDDWAVRNEWGSPADSLSQIFARHRASIENEARFATPRPGPDSGGRLANRVRRDVPASRQARTGVPPDRGAPYRMAHPQMAHPIRPEPLPARRRIAPDLLAIAVIVLVVLAASLAGVKP